MEIVRIDQVPPRVNNDPLFTGGEVTMQVLAAANTDRPLNVTMVNFKNGARNKFHSHTSYQILIVTAGEGIFATEEKKQKISAGDVCISPPGEIHWHGASPGSSLSHITIVAAGSQIKPQED